MMSRKSYETHADLAIVRGCCVRREEYLDYMTFRANDRPLFTELFGPIVGLKDEWREQGATEAELDFTAYTFRCPMAGGVPVKTGFVGGQPVVTLDETDEHLITRDGMGRTMKLCKGAATIPLPLDYPVADMDDWRKMKHHYEFSDDRFGENWEGVAREHLSAGRTVTVNIPGGFDAPRQLMGDEAVCVAYYEQPELIHDILTTIGETAFGVLDRVSSTVQVDQLRVHEDMVRRQAELWQRSMDGAGERWALMANEGGKQLQSALAGAYALR